MADALKYGLTEWGAPLAVLLAAFAFLWLVVYFASDQLECMYRSASYMEKLGRPCPE